MPRRGRCCFQHCVGHRYREVDSGEKFVLRTDVLYPADP
jgi:hypothetical protein